MACCNIITSISVSNCRLTLTNSNNEIVAQFLLGNTTYTLYSDRIFIRDTETSWQLYATSFPIGGLNTMQDLADLIDASIVGCNSGGGTLQFTDVPITLNMENVTDYILVDNSNRAIDIVLPNPIDFYNGGVIKKITIKLIVADFSSDDVTIIPFGSEKIDNQINLIFNQPYQSVSLITDGVNWWIV